MSRKGTSASTSPMFSRPLSVSHCFRVGLVKAGAVTSVCQSELCMAVHGVGCGVVHAAREIVDHIEPCIAVEQRKDLSRSVHESFCCRKGLGAGCHACAGNGARKGEMS